MVVVRIRQMVAFGSVSEHSTTSTFKTKNTDNHSAHHITRLSQIGQIAPLINYKDIIYTVVYLYSAHGHSTIQQPKSKGGRSLGKTSVHLHTGTLIL